MCSLRRFCGSPQLREIGDSTPGDSIGFLFVVLSASACGALAYWLLIRAFWLKALRHRDLFGTIVLCMTATLIGLFGPTIYRTPANYHATQDLAAILPTVSWWFAFSASLCWTASMEAKDKEGISQSDRPDQ